MKHVIELAEGYDVDIGMCEFERPFVSVEVARSNLLEFHEATQWMSRPPLVMFGTLWTLVRDGDLHPMDHDVDFTMFLEDAEEFFRDVMPSLVLLGFRIGRIDGDVLLTLCRGTEYIDIYWMTRVGDRVHAGGPDWSFDRDHFDDPSVLNYRGVDLNIPSDPVSIIEYYVAYLWKRNWAVNHYDYPLGGHIDLSIMIPTIVGREDALNRLLEHLRDQAKVVRGVEILILKDSAGEHTTGMKRNTLIASARGEMCVFIDDDDWVPDDYVATIVGIIRDNPGLDTIGFWGEVLFACGTKRTMIHTVMCPGWTEDSITYYRNPNHINPIRTEIAKRHRFNDITVSEDHYWSIAVNESKDIKSEVFVGEKSMYFYKCKTKLKGL